MTAQQSAALQIGFVSALTDLDTYARDQLGSIRYEASGVFKYVQFGSSRTGQVSAALVQGDAVCYVLGVTADLDLLTLVDEPNSAVGAGIVAAPAGASGVSGQSAVTIPTSGGPWFGWIQVGGTVTLSAAPGGSPAAGAALTTTSASNKKLTATAAYTNQYVGVYIDATNFVANIDFPY